MTTFILCSIKRILIPRVSHFLDKGHHADILFFSKASHGLVQEQKLGFGDQGQADGQPLLGLLGNIPGKLRGPLPEADEFQDLFGLLAAPSLILSGAAGLEEGIPETHTGTAAITDDEVIQDRLVIKEGRCLKGAGNSQGGGLIGPRSR